MLKACHTHPNYSLRAPLGNWTSNKPRTQVWQTVIEPTTNDVFVCNVFAVGGCYIGEVKDIVEHSDCIDAGEFDTSFGLDASFAQ